MNSRTYLSGHPSKRQAGLSLVELLVAVAVGLLLLTGVLAIYASMSNATKTSSLEAQLNEDGALALQILRQQLQQAGYSGLMSGVDGAPNFTGVSVLGCDGGFATIDANYMGSLSTAVTPACGTTVTDPDAIAVRYQADLQNTVAIKDGTDDLPSNCAYEKIGPWKGSGSSAFALAENRFYIAEDSANGNAKTLFCRGIRSSKDGTSPEFGTASALIPNVEDMQLTYAVTAAADPTTGAVSPQVTGIVSANSSPAADPADPSAPAPTAYLGTTLSNWNRVVGVHICLLMRSNETAPSAEMTKANLGYYRDCAGNAITSSTDRYLRRAFRTTVAFRNTRIDIPNAYENNGDPWAKTNE